MCAYYFSSGFIFAKKMFWILFALCIILSLYFIFIKPFTYWTRKGIIQQNIFDVWSENLRQILNFRPHAESVKALYNLFPNERYAGFYRFLSPLLFLRDHDLIKQIVVKDFDHFLDHNISFSEEYEPLCAKNLFLLKGEKWKDMRTILSPSFTSSKMRAMFCLINDCAKQSAGHFKREGSETLTVELKDVFSRYNNDVIASTAFGITCDSLKYPENEFYLMAREATSVTGFWKHVMGFIIFTFPKLAMLLGLKIFNKKVSEFFRKVVKGNVEAREKGGIVRPDMIHLLMEAKKGILKHDNQINKSEDIGFAVIEESSVGKGGKPQKTQLTHDDLTGQAIMFLFAGLENIAVLMCFAAYELAVNRDIQERLRKEVNDTLRNCGGTLTCEAILKMKYLDMVVTESLRKWPPVLIADRVCTKPYTIQPVTHGENPLHLKPGDAVVLPVFGIQRDPKFYPEPDRFDPERFSDENKSNIYPYSFLPFGAGPRNCIGNRFALLAAKTGLFHILSHFEVVVVEETTIPMKIAKGEFTLNSANGFWLGLKPRTV